MSAIAQYMSWMNCIVTGSDRLAGTDAPPVRGMIEATGCRVFPQDGSGVSADTKAVVVSTAIEADNPDIAAAIKLGVPVIHRSDLLAAIADSMNTVAVAGTSGKSTVSALIFHILDKCDKSPSLITGAGLNSLRNRGLAGNAFVGKSEILVIEADESDGTLVKYHPSIALLLNCSKDHKEVSDIQKLFSTFVNQSRLSIKNAGDENLGSIKTDKTFGMSDADFSVGSDYELGSTSVSFTIDKTRISLPYPGRHNLMNLLAAYSVCKTLGCSTEEIAKASATYGGIERRFDILRSSNGPIVIDDYAHNPEKIRAVLTTAQDMSPKVIAIFQPHGFGPMRFLFNDLLEMFSEILRETDVLILSPIYDAGGTADRSISSGDLAEALSKQTTAIIIAPKNRDDVWGIIEGKMSDDVVILSMGARDTTLGDFARGLSVGLR